MATARDLLEQASSLLGDPQKANWSNAELLGHLNDGLKLLVSRRPEQFSKVQTVTLVEGAMQTLPEAGAVLISVLYSHDARRAPRFVPKAELDAWRPGWRAATPGATTEWTYDPRTPKVYWVSPPAVAGSKLDIDFAEYPSTLLINSVIPVDGAYHGALVDYVVYRALSKDADYAGEDGRANVFFKSFLEKIGGGDSGSTG